jgi:hypothetical protein
LLLNRVCDEFEKLRQTPVDSGGEKEPPPIVEKTANQKTAAEVRTKILEMGDELLLMAFESSLQIAERQGGVPEESAGIQPKDKFSAFRLYQQ